MSQYIETICAKAGVIQNLDLHLGRMNEVRHRKFGAAPYSKVEFQIRIEEACSPFSDAKEKIRVLYAGEIVSIEKSIYQMREITTLRLVFDDQIEYSDKSTERGALEQLFALRGDYDEIIVVKNGFITDTSYTNLAFESKRGWVTPASPLLRGTKRRELLESGFLTEANIRPQDLSYFKQLMLINAMIGKFERVLPIESIVF